MVRNSVSIPKVLATVTSAPAPAFPTSAVVIPKISPTAYPLPVAAIDTDEIVPAALTTTCDAVAPDPSPVIENRFIVPL